MHIQIEMYKKIQNEMHIQIEMYIMDAYDGYIKTYRLITKYIFTAAAKM